MKIYFYSDSRGHQPVYDWIKSIEKEDPETFRKTIYLLTLLEENGDLVRSGKSNRNDIKRLKKTNGIWQLRINENRLLFFFFEEDKIVFTNHFKKKSNSTPPNEIKRAERRKEIWIRRKQ